MKLVTGIFAAIALSCSAASAQAIFNQKTDFATLELHTGWSEENGDRVAGLRVELEPGWKTYWRNPGDAGIPPDFDWEGSENIAGVSIEWPRPLLFDTYGSLTIGYEGRMVLPMRFEPVDPAKPMHIRLGFSYGLCKDICIPAFEEIVIEIEPNAAEDGAYFIRSAQSNMPSTAEQIGLVEAACRVEGAGESRQFEASLAFAGPVNRAPHIVAEGPDGVWIGPLTSSIEAGVIMVEGPVETEAGRWVDRSEINITLLSNAGAASIKGCAAFG